MSVFRTFSQKADTQLKRIGLLLLVISVVIFVLNFFAWKINGESLARKLSYLFTMQFQPMRHYSVIAYSAICGALVGFFFYKGLADKLYVWIKTGNFQK